MNSLTPLGFNLTLSTSLYITCLIWSTNNIFYGFMDCMLWIHDNLLYYGSGF